MKRGRRHNRAVAAANTRSESLVRRKWWVAGFAAISLAGVSIVWWNAAHVPSIPIPEVALQEAAPGVEGAIRRAREAVVAAPRSSEAWGEFGMLLFAHQFEQEANVALTQAARLAPREFRWPYLLGISLAVSDPSVAADHFRQALALRSDLPVAHLRLGELLLTSEQLDDAAKHLDAAARGDDSDPRVHYDLARLSVARGDLPNAGRWAEQAARLAPEIKSVHELLATIHQKIGNRELARREMELAEQSPELALGWKDPIAASVLALRQDAASLQEYAKSLLSAGQTAEAVRALQQAIRTDDRDPRLYGLLARTLIQSQQFTEARELLERAERRHPLVAEIQFQRGNVEFFLNNPSPAETHFREAIRLHPDFALAHYNLGHVLVKQDRGQEALDSFESAVRLRPDHADACINAGKLLLREGKKELALRYLRQAEKFKPQDRGLRELLEQLK